LITGGGGGWGDPRKRTRESVLSDLKEGYISEKAARDTYGQRP
jgi:N-methylhydantoinase B